MELRERPGALRAATWRYVLLLLILAGASGFVLSMDRLSQSASYHRFADQRSFLGVPNCLDVISNIAFLAAGVAGFVFLARRPGTLRTAWLTFCLGVTMVSAGSAYYHWNPDNAALVWDRLPITIAFMGILAAILGEYVSLRLGRSLLAPAVLLGLASVLYWHWYDDLRFYYCVQLIPLLTVPIVMVLFRAPYSQQWILLIAVGLYGFAKIAEGYDREVFALTRQLFSGHTLKHLLAACSCYAVVVFLKRRTVR